jgi:ribonuclease D
MKYLDKDEIKNYPLIDFDGRIHLVDDLKKNSTFKEKIKSAEVVGFDTETKPAFKKGVYNSISLVQISIDNEIFLFRINKIGLFNELIKLFENSKIIKVGIDLKNDINGLNKIKSFEANSFVDLNKIAKNNDFKSFGAIKLSILMLGKRISKKQRLSDWEVDTLSESQKNYAAIDAWICPKILNEFKKRDYLLS